TRSGRTWTRGEAPELRSRRPLADRRDRAGLPARGPLGASGPRHARRVLGPAGDRRADRERRLAGAVRPRRVRAASRTRGGRGRAAATALRRRRRARARGPPAEPEPSSRSFHALYRTDDEWAAEIANRTVHGVMHVAWVRDPPSSGQQVSDRYHGELGVYVK